MLTLISWGFPKLSWKWAGLGREWLRTEGGPRRRGIALDPEGDPGEDHGQDAGDVGLDGEVAHPSAEVEVNRHQHVLACRREKSSQMLAPTFI